MCLPAWTQCIAFVLASVCLLQQDLSALQLRFSGEDLSAISPEWRLEWCAESVQGLEKDRLLCVGDSPVPGVTDEQWEKLRQQVGGQAEGRGFHWSVDVNHSVAIYSAVRSGSLLLTRIISIVTRFMDVS